MQSRIARSVTATQLVRDLAAIRTMVADGPVGITSHNRTELVVLSAPQFSDLAKSGVQSDPAVLDAKLTTVLEAIDTHVVILNRDLQVRRINRAMRMVFGIEGDDFRGKPIMDFLPASSAPFFAKRLKEVVVSGQVAEFDYVSSIRPGRTVHARIVPWPGGVIYLADDITDRLAGMERDFELSAVRSAVAALGGHGSGSLDENGIILTIDPGFSEMTGASGEQMTGRRFASLFDPTQRASIEKMIASAGKHRAIDVGYLRNGVSIAQARLALAPFFGGDGRPKLAFVVEDRAFGG